MPDQPRIELPLEFNEKGAKRVTRELEKQLRLSAKIAANFAKMNLRGGISGGTTRSVGGGGLGSGALAAATIATRGSSRVAVQQTAGMNNVAKSANKAAGGFDFLTKRMGTFAASFIGVSAAIAAFKSSLTTGARYERQGSERTALGVPLAARDFLSVANKSGISNDLIHEAFIQGKSNALLDGSTLKEQIRQSARFAHFAEFRRKSPEEIAKGLHEIKSRAVVGKVSQGEVDRYGDFYGRDFLDRNIPFHKDIDRLVGLSRQGKSAVDHTGKVSGKKGTVLDEEWIANYLRNVYNQSEDYILDGKVTPMIQKAIDGGAYDFNLLAREAMKGLDAEMAKFGNNLEDLQVRIGQKAVPALQAFNNEYERYKYFNPDDGRPRDIPRLDETKIPFLPNNRDDNTERVYTIKFAPEEAAQFFESVKDGARLGILEANP